MIISIGILFDQRKPNKLKTKIMTRIQFNDQGFKTLGSLVNEIFNDVNTGNRFFPPVNISENENNFELVLMVPGRKKEDFKIALDKDILTVSYEQKEEKADEKTRIVKNEFTLRSFSRSFTLNEEIDRDSIAASYENGLLKLALPKKEEVKISPKEISIQ